MRTRWVEYVYYVRIGDRFKVGHSWDPESRIRGLLKLRATDELMIVRYPFPKARHAEKRLRDWFVLDLAPGMGREWFTWSSTSLQQVNAVIRGTKMSKRQIGAQLVAARIKRDVTQAQLSDEMGVSQEMIAMIERGTKNPGKSLATKLESWISGGSHSEDAPRGARGSYEKVAARIRKRTR